MESRGRQMTLKKDTFKIKWAKKLILRKIKLYK